MLRLVFVLLTLWCYPGAPKDLRKREGLLWENGLMGLDPQNGRGEWIRTTDLLVPNQGYPAISLNTELIFSCKTSI